jgi:NADH-quinone oxidoreductase subunit N
VLTTLLSHTSYILPELLLLIGISFILMLESNYGGEADAPAAGHDHDHGHAPSVPADPNKRPMVMLIAGLVAAAGLGLLIANLRVPSINLFASSLVIDQFSTTIKIFLLAAFAGLIYLHATTKDWDESFQSEFLALSAGVLIGAMMLASSVNLLMVYVSLETISIISYVLASLKKRSDLSSEAGLKYVIYGGVSAAIMLFGLSHLYGLVGSLDLAQVCDKLRALSGGELLGAQWCLLLFFVGIAFKVSAFPFHQWSPDVYEGSPLVVTAFFSLVPKFAALAFLTRFTYSLASEGPSAIAQWWQYLMVLVALLTMTVANLCALGQESVKRLLAYSSMANIGILMLLLGLTPAEGVQALLFYAGIYLIMTLAAFYAVDLVVSSYQSDAHYFFRGLASRNPWSAIFFVIVLFSLAGLPPFAGFIAKFNVFMLLLSHQYFWPAVVLALNSILTLYYYLRLIKTVAVDKSDDLTPLAQETFLRKLFLGALTVPLVVLGIFWDSFYFAFKTTTLALF